MRPLAPPKTAATGIVDRVKLPGQMTPVLTEPMMEASSEPFYVKLRAEVDADFFRTGHGQLYIGFFLDPLYKVHWNNRAMPVVFEVESTTGIIVADDSVEGPDVEVDADADPREFLLDLCDDVAGDSRAPHEIVIDPVNEVNGCCCRATNGATSTALPSGRSLTLRRTISPWCRSCDSSHASAVSSC